MIGVILGSSPIDPIKPLYWAAVLNGVISAPIMAAMMLMAANPKVMGDFVISTRLKVLGWIATSVMAVAVGFMLLQVFV